MESFQEFYARRSGTRLNKSKRARFVAYWRGLQPNVPIYMQPIAKDHRGDSFNQDTIRLTGSPAFISSVIGRLKDIILLDSDKSRLEISYRRVKVPRDDGTWSFSLYVRAKSRH